MTVRRGGFWAQRGGFAMGLIVGLLLGLAMALAVALYVTKVPIPFVNKVPQRSAEQDAAEAERNRNWDPNAPLAGKPRAPLPITGTASAPAAVLPPASAPTSTRDPAAILGERPTAAVRPPPPAIDPFLYFVQAGAFSRTEDAEQQRAKLAMMGFEAKVSEREQSGRTMYRVRIGPFARRDDADGAKERLVGAGVDSALVRVQK